jgi:hypothetical protein
MKKYSRIREKGRDDRDGVETGRREGDRDSRLKVNSGINFRHNIEPRRRERREPS